MRFSLLLVLTCIASVHSYRVVVRTVWKRRAFIVRCCNEAQGCWAQGKKLTSTEISSVSTVETSGDAQVDPAVTTEVVTTAPSVTESTSTVLTTLTSGDPATSVVIVNTTGITAGATAAGATTAATTAGVTMVATTAGGPTITAAATTAGGTMVATTAGGTTVATTAGGTTVATTTGGTTVAGPTTTVAATTGSATTQPTTTQIGTSATAGMVTTDSTTAAGVTTTTSATTQSTTTGTTTATTTGSTTTTTEGTTTTTTDCPDSQKCVSQLCIDSAKAKQAALDAVPSTTAYPGNLPLTDINGTWYYIVKTKQLSFFDALTFCRTNGMDLVSIETQQEQDNINAHLAAIGLSGSWVITSGNRLPTRCFYMWENGDPLSWQPMPMTAWNTGEPAHLTSENCLMLQSGKWLDVYCVAVTYFMCEQRPGQTITTTTPCPYLNCTTGDCDADVGRKAKAIAAVPSTTEYPGNFAVVDLGGTYYYLDKTKAMSWFDGLTYCRSIGMDLVSIGSQAEQDAIDGYLTKLGVLGNWVWTSGNKIGPICPYTWVDGSPLTFLNWPPGEPSASTGENCQMTCNKKWYDLSCSFGTYFLCEAPAGTILTTTTPCPYSKCTSFECVANIAKKKAAIDAVPATTNYPGTLPKTSLFQLGGTYYYIDKSKLLSWFDALTFCRTNGMDLASIYSKEEQDAINAQLTTLGLVGSFVHLSGNKIGPICPYTWVDGSPLNYTNWEPGDPANSVTEECMIVCYKTWRDFPCVMPTYFICKQLSNTVITTPPP